MCYQFHSKEVHHQNYNKCIAERTLARPGRRLAKYKSGIDDLIERGYAEPVDEREGTSGATWYIPHHGCLEH